MPGWLCTKRLCGGRLGQQRAQRLPQHQQRLHRHGGSGGTKSSARLSPQRHPAHPTYHTGLQGWGKGGFMGSVFSWAMPERKNVHLLHHHLLPALSFAAQTGLFQSLCFPALGNNNLWPLFFSELIKASPFSDKNFSCLLLGA